MRTYPANSPEAAARIVVLTMLADGHLSKAELDTLERHGGYQQLGLEPEQLQEVVLALCEDLQFSANLAWADACRLDPATLSALMSEIDDDELRQRVLALCVQVAGVDALLSDGESLMITRAEAQWRLPARLPPATGFRGAASARSHRQRPAPAEHLQSRGR
jgi:uncharacterized tellurite resistance protein B-like protein